MPAHKHELHNVARMFCDVYLAFYFEEITEETKDKFFEKDER